MKTQTTPTLPGTFDADVQHITLCMEDAPCPPGCAGCDRALCGADLTDEPWVAEHPTPCPLCHTIELDED